MRRRRFRWHWPKTWLILQSVNTGMLAGAPLQFFGMERSAVVMAVVIAFVLLVRGWVRLEAATPLYVQATEEDDAAVRTALSLGARGAQGSPIRFLLPFAATLAIVAVALIWALSRDWIGRTPGLRLIPEWVFGWIAADLLIAGLAVVASAYYAFERLDNLVGIWVDANSDAWSSFTSQLDAIPLPKPTLIGNGYIVLGAIDLTSRSGRADLAAVQSHLSALHHRVIPWPGVCFQRGSSDSTKQPPDLVGSKGAPPL